MKRLKQIVIFLIFAFCEFSQLFIIHSNVLAQEVIEESVKVANSVPIKEALATKSVAEPNIFSLFLSLTIVIGLIVLTGWLFLKLNKSFPKLLAKRANIDIGEKIDVLSSVNLGNNKTLHLIKVKNKQFLVGSTPTNVNLISEISSEKID